MRTRASIVLLTLSFVVFSALVCTGQEKEATKAGRMRELASDNAVFALNLYQEWRGERDNLFFSPYSISSVLAMTYGGARGNTATQMAQVLNFKKEGEDLQEVFGLLGEALNSRESSGEIELSTASALWGQQGTKFLEDFLGVGRRYYRAELKSLDFSGDPAGAAGQINAWSSDATKGRIPTLIDPGMLTKDTMLVLTNAVYFNGVWVHKFDGDMTLREPFWVAPDSSIMVDMMHQTQSFEYVDTGGLKILELPYAGHELSMFVLLPKDRNGLRSVERFLTVESLRKWIRLLRDEEVIVSLPRFKFSTSMFLNDTLKDMGMTDAFSAGAADFSGMSGTKDLFINAVVHKGFIEVDEEGTEAAASTAVVMEKTASISAGPKRFQADHPFIFLIRDNKTGSILFLGRVMDPR